jgi:SAM-dependent methyltransferase
MDVVIPRWCPSPGTALDLGAGSGSLASRLSTLGWDIVAVERDAEGFGADVPFVEWDFDSPGRPARLLGETFDLVVATEVIEHLENPIAFLRLVSSMLAREGIAVLTTPNVDSVLARLRFLLSDRVRMMDASSDPTHISPIFLDLFLRQFLPRSALRLVARHTYPEQGFLLTRDWVEPLGRLLSRVLPGTSNVGDNHVFVLARSWPRDE